MHNRTFVVPAGELVVRHGSKLPHWTVDHAIYHVVFRLHDSLPAHVLRNFEAERDRLLAAKGLTAQDLKRLKYLVSERVEEYLDRGYGACYMRRVSIANRMESIIKHFDRVRYHLHAWAVMPNHVHVVVEPADGFELNQILHSWKSFSSSDINNLLGRSGSLWQSESYDRIIRNPKAYAKVVAYVENNPAKAGLHHWKWCSKPIA